MPVYTPPPGGTTDLLFRRVLDTTHPVDLVFGPDEAAAGSDAVGVGQVSMPGLLSVSAVGSYDNAVPRGLRAGAGAGWQRGTGRADEVQVPFEHAGRAVVLDAAPWVQATPKPVHIALPSALAARAVVGSALPWELGQHQALQVLGDWVPRTRQRPGVAATWERGGAQRHQTLGGWVPMTRRRADVSAMPWQRGAAHRLHWATRQGRGTLLVQQDMLPWGLASRPNGGVYVNPPVPPLPERCYTPPHGLAVELLLAERWFGPSNVLRFRCRLIDLPATYTIPYRRTYMAVHTITAARLGDATPFTLDSCAISADADGFGWSLQASGPGNLMTLLAPDAGGPCLVSITIDTLQWVFAVESLGRSRSFGETRVTVRGRSVSALLGAPYAVSSAWTNASARTAAQILGDAVENTALTIDASLIEDWLIPAGAWSHTGPPLSAVMRVAESIGAVVVSDRADPVLRLLPRYPLMPWEWGGAAVAPDVRLPLASVITEGYERRDAPAYNRAVVSGTSQGVLGIITRTGSGGTLSAPMVTDGLATATAATVQRGRSILGAAGKQALITLEMPVLSGPGLPAVLDLNQLVEVVEPGETWRGLVRGVSLRAGLPVVRQTVTIERHFEN